MSYAHDVSSVIKYRQRRRLNSLSDRKKSLQANLFYTCHLSHVWSCCQFYVNMSWVKRLMTWVSFVQSSHLPVFPTLQQRPTFKGSDHPSYRKVNLSNYQMTKAMFSRTPMCVNDIPCIIVNCFFWEISSVTTFVTLWIWFLYVSIITYYWWTKCDKPFYNVTSLYKKNKTDTHTHTHTQKKKTHTHPSTESQPGFFYINKYRLRRQIPSKARPRSKAIQISVADGIKHAILVCFNDSIDEISDFSVSSNKKRDGSLWRYPRFTWWLFLFCCTCSGVGNLILGILLWLSWWFSVDFSPCGFSGSVDGRGTGLGSWDILDLLWPNGIFSRNNEALGVNMFKTITRSDTAV